MKCDVCKNNIKYEESYIYKLPENIEFCLNCASKHIPQEQIDNDPDKNWRVSIFNK